MSVILLRLRLSPTEIQHRWQLPTFPEQTLEHSIVEAVGFGPFWIWTRASLRDPQSRLPPSDCAPRSQSLLSNCPWKWPGESKCHWFSFWRRVLGAGTTHRKTRICLYLEPRKPQGDVPRLWCRMARSWIQVRFQEACSQDLGEKFEKSTV